VYAGNFILTVNAHSYTIITAHKAKKAAAGQRAKTRP
jgi:hypothetical protein